MTAVSFTGLASVTDRTVFTAKGPIVKAPVPLLTGANLQVTGPADVYVPTGSFNSGLVGKTLQISGSSGGRNDGTFYVKGVPSTKSLTLENADFDVTDVAATTASLVALTNALLSKFNAHLTRPGVHPVNDPGDSVNVQAAVDLASANIVLNALLPKLNAHFALGSPVHLQPDLVDTVAAPPATSLESAILLANRIRAGFEHHRSSTAYHLEPDAADAVGPGPVQPVLKTFPGPLTGPFTWTLYDPRSGQIADDPSDVRVLVNSALAPVDAVFGLMGAVVLSSKPAHLSTVTVDYSYLANPPVQFERLNSPEFNLNQAGNRAFSGFPQHRYRARSALARPKNLSLPAVKSFTAPRLVGWRYKGVERAYSAVLNDPNTLLLNVPTNRLAFPVLQTTVFETVIRYDPVTLPQSATDPWILEGDASGLSLNSSVPELIVLDTTTSSSAPPFFTHALDLTFPSLVSAAFRAVVYDSVPDGVFTGSCFGLSDGARAAVTGFLSTEANNLSSCIVLVNSLKAALNAHVVQPTVHDPDDPSDSVQVVDATSLPSAIILANAVRSAFNAHVNKNGPSGVHQNPDPSDALLSPAAHDLATAVALVNEVRTKFNAHLTSPGVHFVSDAFNSVGLVKQVGFLTNRGFPEFDTSWNSYAVDWSSYKTYRIFRDPSGGVSLFLSGSVDPIATAGAGELPPISSLAGKFDPLQQAFFGSISYESTSRTGWAFVRIDTNPLDSNQVGDNKSVDYEPLTVPELDPSAPWIVVGQGGYDRISSTSQLVVDSTASASPDEVAALGLSSGAYRGFLRYEPTMTARASASVEFTGSVGYYTFSLDDRASGVFLDDDQFSVHVVFLQATPTPASVTGSSFGPFTGLNPATDTLIVSLNGSQPVTVSFTGIADTQTVTVANRINTALGVTLASPNPADTPPNSRLLLTSPTSGSSSKIQVIASTAATKFGLSPGTYFGLDSNPEPKLSWFGEARPDQDVPTWNVTGTQAPSMMFRTLRITDSSFFDYLAYVINDPLTTKRVFGPGLDWKLDFRLAVQSHVPGAAVGGFSFCGALLSMDEGPGGKHVQVQLTTDVNGIPYVSVLSYSNVTNTLVPVVSAPFTWNDKKVHTFNVFTSKGANTMILLADGTMLASFPYSGLQAGAAGPSIAFGSGGSPVLNQDLRTAQSVVDWGSVAVFRDQKVSDPTAASRRYIGLYKGGDRTLLSSYYLQQVDWTAQHTYRIVRDPSSTVSVFLDGAQVPVISVNYDVLSLPPVSTSFLNGITGGRPSVAFGSFNPFEIDRTFWARVKYSIGKITLTNRLVPSHQVVNQANAMASPDHLLAKGPHSHAGFKVYSGGTPVDDFLADENGPMFTVLGGRTPPVPMTQDLQFRGGMSTSFTPVESLDSTAVVNQAGFLSNFEDDTAHAIPSPAVLPLTAAALSALIVRVNGLKIHYVGHLTRPLVHVVNDTVNTISSPDATDLASAIVLINEMRTKYDAHLTQAGVHVHDDLQHPVPSSLAAATDLASAVALAESFATEYFIHSQAGKFHYAFDSTDLWGGPMIDPSSSLLNTTQLLNDLKLKYNLHRTQPTIHSVNDLVNAVTAAPAVDLSSSIALANDLRNQFLSHMVSSTFHQISDTPDLVLSPPATDLTSLLLLSYELPIVFNAHLLGDVLVHQLDGTVLSVQVHATNDITNTETLFSSVSLFLSLLQRLVANFNGHRTGKFLFSPVHAVDDLVNDVAFIALYRMAPPVSIDVKSTINQLLRLRDGYNRHIVQPGVHFADDLWLGESGAGPTDLLSAITFMNDLGGLYNAHLGGSAYHIQSDAPGTVDPASFDPIARAIATANQLQQLMNEHFTYKRSHARVEPPPPPPPTVLPEDSPQDPLPPFPPPPAPFLILSPPAKDLPSLIALVNEEQSRFNSHLTVPWAHVGHDSVNLLTSPPATDLDSCIVALNEMQPKYGAHLRQTGVHGSSVFVRLDPPSGVLYEDTKFFQFPSGDVGVLSPFSDDETLHLDGLKNQGDRFMTYPAGAAPEHAVLVGNNVPPFPIVAGDVLSVGLDGAAPISVFFQASDTSTINVVSRINSTPGIPAGFARDNGDGRVRLTSSVGASNSAIAISGSASSKLGLDVAQTTPWVLLSGDPASVTVVPMTSGPTDFLRYSTTGAGTDTVYRNRTGLPDATSMDFDLTVAVRINTAVPGPTGDTGIYVGISGIAGPGYTAAIGFEFVNGIRIVKLVDLKSGVPHFQRPYNWGDGNFHTYRISRVQAGDAIQFTIVS